MKTREFLSLLEQNPEKELVFEYQKNEFVPKAYHITEVKTTHVDSVDCGGFAHSYNETVVQLWVNGNEEKEKNMEAGKALKIFNIVDGKKPLLQDTPIFFEWGYGELRTSVYEVQTVENQEDKLVVKLLVPHTACKPMLILETVQGKSGGGCCGSGEPSESALTSSSKCC